MYRRCHGTATQVLFGHWLVQPRATPPTELAQPWKALDIGFKSKCATASFVLAWFGLFALDRLYLRHL